MTSASLPSTSARSVATGSGFGLSSMSSSGLNGGSVARSRYRSSLTPPGASRASASNAAMFVDARRRLPEMASSLMGLFGGGNSLIGRRPNRLGFSCRGRCSVLVAGPDDRTLHDLGVLERTPHGKDA